MIRHYLANLNPRERMLVLAATAVIILWLLWLLLFSPLLSAVEFRQNLLREQRETLAFMQNVRKEHPEKSVSVKASGNQLLAGISSSLASGEFRSFPCQIQQTASGDIQLSCEKIPFTPFVRWLWELDEKFAFRIREFGTESSDTPGIVRQTVVITPSA